MIREFRDLRVWQLAHELTVQIYKTSGLFPKEELYGIVSQLRRSSSSVGANISEGFSRNTKKEFIQFLYIGKGSLTETINHLLLAKDLGYVNEEEYLSLEERYVALNKQINALILSIKKNYVS